jgi:hypothetical protein
MKDFKKIMMICEGKSRISEKVLDNFLISFAAGRNNLEGEMKTRFDRFKHITKQFDPKWTRMLMAQYLAHRIFRENGLINNLLNLPALKRLDIQERSFLESQAKLPWKFSFSVIIDSPAENFYTMKDVFSDQEYLLYSQGVSKILTDQSVSLWFNLICNNGACWQTYGPIAAYNSFGQDDIFFFAAEIKSDITDEEDLLENLEQNPVPYMMLLSGANYPPTYNKKDRLIQTISEYDMEDMNTKSMTAKFITEYNKGVYRLSLKIWDKMPHFACAYYDENKKIILLTSMTDRGFRALVKNLNEYGYDFFKEPSLRLNLSIMTTASDILKKKIILNEYEHLFTKETSPEEQKSMDKINEFIGLILPDINAGRKPDILKFASQSGIDAQIARELLDHILKKTKKM